MALFGRKGAAAERRGTPADLLVVGLGNPGADYAGTRHNIGALVVVRLAGRHDGTFRRSRERADVAEIRLPRPAVIGHGQDSVISEGLAPGEDPTSSGQPEPREPWRVVLAIPHTYMNLSGEAVGPLARRHGVTEPERVVVLHDELDLDPGRIKVKRGGGLAGHNGLKSVASHLHTQDFLRVRIGVGKPPGRMSGKDWVLRRPGKAEREVLDVAVEESADAVEMILTDGVEAAMNRFNAR